MVEAPVKVKLPAPLSLKAKIPVLEPDPTKLVMVYAPLPEFVNCKPCELFPDIVVILVKVTAPESVEAKTPVAVNVPVVTAVAVIGPDPLKFNVVNPPVTVLVTLVAVKAPVPVFCRVKLVKPESENVPSVKAPFPELNTLITGAVVLDADKFSVLAADILSLIVKVPVVVLTWLTVKPAEPETTIEVKFASVVPLLVYTSEAVLVLLTVNEVAVEAVALVICSIAVPVNVTLFKVASFKVTVLMVLAVFVLLTVNVVATSCAIVALRPAAPLTIKLLIPSPAV